MTEYMNKTSRKIRKTAHCNKLYCNIFNDSLNLSKVKDLLIFRAVSLLLLPILRYWKYDLCLTPLVSPCFHYSTYGQDKRFEVIFCLRITSVRCYDIFFVDKEENNFWKGVGFIIFCCFRENMRHLYLYIIIYVYMCIYI